MTDTDRLTALLHDLDLVVASDPQSGYSRERQRGWDEAIATVRSLAAGVTLAPTPPDALREAAQEVVRFYGTDRTWSLLFRELLGSRIDDLAAAQGTAKEPQSLVVPTEDGYTCGECGWGRADQPRSLGDYVAHVNAEHPTGPHRDFGGES